MISNKSNGADHGHDSLALVMGSQTAGGKIQGYYPRLDTKSLDWGVDLAVTTNYLEVLSAI